jgi:hypothetical protein
MEEPINPNDNERSARDQSAQKVIELAKSPSSDQRDEKNTATQVTS